MGDLIRYHESVAGLVGHPLRQPAPPGIDVEARGGEHSSLNSTSPSAPTPVKLGSFIFNSHLSYWVPSHLFRGEAFHLSRNILPQPTVVT
ncbi:hypothetical protein E2C01_071953 [Portunus trituberculatus]|uniref:Uncharacterized protein n=1 Tax=Portunus trituberculatus TaxID=210409 RepID=A0A5B7I7M8_PORTR|nr:hypothetical protein [Portunus trituberculatus]